MDLLKSCGIELEPEFWVLFNGKNAGIYASKKNLLDNVHRCKHPVIGRFTNEEEAKNKLKSYRQGEFIRSLRPRPKPKFKRLF